jgi:hypothetical protein
MNMNVFKNLFLRIAHVIPLAFCVFLVLKTIITAHTVKEIVFLKPNFRLLMDDASVPKVPRIQIIQYVQVFNININIMKCEIKFFNFF